MSEKIGVFEESPGVASSGRVMSFISLVAAIVFGVMEIKAKVPIPYVCFAFLTAATGIKVGQKFAEKK